MWSIYSWHCHTKTYKMDCCREEHDMAANETESGEEYIHKLLYASGAALTMACFRRVMMEFFMEHWRVKVFLLLNVVLLAILYSSSRFSSCDIQGSSDDVEKKKKIEKRKRRPRKQCEQSRKLKSSKDGVPLQCESMDDAKEVEQQHLTAKSEPPLKLSTEELNERVEAFIAMFRQHLVLDAKLQGESEFPRSQYQRKTC